MELMTAQQHLQAAQEALWFSHHLEVGNEGDRGSWLRCAEVHAHLADVATRLGLVGDEEQQQHAEPLVTCDARHRDFPAPGTICRLPIGIHDDGYHEGRVMSDLARVRRWPQVPPPYTTAEGTKPKCANCLHPASVHDADGCTLLECSCQKIRPPRTSLIPSAALFAPPLELPAPCPEIRQ